MPNDGEMMTTIVEVKIDEDLLQHPAIPESDPWNKVYFIRGDKVVANGRIGSRVGNEVVVYLEPDDVKSRDYFIAQNDYAIQTLGRHTAWRFASFDGGPLPMYSDEPEDRCDDLWIVSTWEFDYGFASKKRYGHIEGFGTALNQEKTDVSHS